MTTTVVLIDVVGGSVVGAVSVEGDATVDVDELGADVVVLPSTAVGSSPLLQLASVRASAATTTTARRVLRPSDPSMASPR